MHVVVVGKDARTHALAAACAASASRPRVSAVSEHRVPGLVDVCDDVHCVPSLASVRDVVGVVGGVGADLVLVGPEDPLAAGLVDALEARSIPCVGPTKAHARIESSKSWARGLLARHGVPGNPAHVVLDDAAAVEPALAALGDFVVKPDGLTGGKGVRVLGEHLSSVREASAYAAACIEAGGRVVVEERLEGEEFSLQTITDGTSAVHCPVVQDHKRAEEGDAGPNTGGMGSYSCPDGSLPFLDPDDVEAARRINEAVVAALAAEIGSPYRGVLYGGFMATGDGVRVIEYNARFGDPEALNVLPLLATDFVDLCAAVAGGTLAEVEVRFEPRATVCKYVVPAGYPGTKDAGGRIEIRPLHFDESQLRLYWAATERRDDGFHLTGSRALAFVGIGATVADAERIAEAGACSVSGPVRHRADIGTDALLARRVAHMSALRGRPAG